MTTDNGNVDTQPGDPIGPGTPAWEAGDDAVKALVHCFKQIQPHVKESVLEYALADWANSIVTEAVEEHKRLAA